MKTVAGIKGVEWATWQTSVLICARVGRMGIRGGRALSVGKCELVVVF